jgi:BirA family biotin operon repressor/biotin-[acetyl-CoA-carboxylase] ligase
LTAAYDGERLARSLARGGPGRRLEIHPSLPSTQERAFALAEEGAADGTCVVADRQTEGRGRRGRGWDSPAGAGIWCSLVLRPPPGPEAAGPLLVAATAVAAAEAIGGTAGLRVLLRWPNDLLAGERKVGGVLLETRDFDPAAPLCVLGLGLNVSQAREEFPAELRGAATSLRAETGREPDRTAVLAAVVESLDAWRSRTAAEVEAAYRARAAFLGREVALLEGDAPRAGVLEDVSPRGGVVLRLPGGGRRVVRAEHARELRPLPEVSIRPARPEDAEGIARVQGDAWRAAYRGLVPDAFLERHGREPDAVERRRRWIADPASLNFVAEIGGRVEGFANAGPVRELPPRFDAELRAIYVHPDHARRGIGRRLFHAAVAALRGRGARSMGLWVLRDNGPARAFYGGLGGVPGEGKTIAIGGASLPEIVYGWEDLGALVPGETPGGI